MAGPSPNYLYGLVDMGSNGIRFSITDLTPTTTRSLPTVFQERLGISLYDAQYSTGVKGPIPQNVIDDVVSSLKRFKSVCADFGVPTQNTQILATEATRNAINSEDYRKQIKDHTGWDVKLLPKEQEGRIGAFGVASSFDSVDGLVMDLGGGSTQITWMIAEGGQVTTSPKGSFSFPYGAAALTQKLSEITTKDARKELKETMRSQFKDAFANLEVPESLRNKAEHYGLTLYLSGGGFRGWGYLLMSKHKLKPYPIPIINGFHVPVKEFGNTDDVQELAAEHADIFRVSKRRAAQVPAVAFLVNALIEALPFISDVRFCQGGIREGFLYDSLLPEIRAASPIISGTFKYSTQPDSSPLIADLLASTLPGANHLDRSVPAVFRPALLHALANTMYVQSSSIKESASVAALYLPITGVLSSAHGVSHIDRALLGLMLCQRWGGELPPPHDNLLQSLQGLLSQQEAWWCGYLGRVAALVGNVYPAGRIPDPKAPRITFSAKWSEGLGKKGNMQGVVLSMRLSKKEAVLSKELWKEGVEQIEDAGKKKNRIGGKEYGFGVPVNVDVEWL